MGRTVTTTRESPNKVAYPFSMKAFGNTVSGSDYIATYLADAIPQLQTTTSYRTVPAGSGVDDELKNLDEATNELQAVRAIARDTAQFSNSYDTGHEFSTVQGWAKFSLTDWHYFNPTNGNTHQGPLIQHPGFLFYRPAMPSVPDFSDLSFYGANAIRNTIPTNPLTNLAVSLAEIYRDGLPRLPHFLGLAEKGFSFVKNLADEYLNYQFGWKPTVSDTVAALNAVDQAHKAIQQFIRDNGKTIRRSYAFPEQKATQMHTGGSSSIFDPSQAHSGTYFSTGSVTETLLTTRRIWFKGAYSYFIPLDKSLLSRLERYASLSQKAFGLEITPEVLWNIAPWSWFGGWLSDISTVIHNLNAFSQDGLVLRYGYLMVQDECIHTVSTSGVVVHYGATDPPPFTEVYRTVRKQRFKATPYGFGLNPNSFTDSQWSILGAIGLSRSPGTLRN